MFLIIIKKKRFKKKKYKSVPFKEHTIAYRLFVEFPKRLATDLINKNPDEFKEYGLHMVCGEQGAGKSITCAYILKKWKCKHPQLFIRSNSKLTFQDEKLLSVEQIMDNRKTIYGQVDYLEEIQAQFNCANSKNVPPEIISEICMQRKQHKVIMGNGQVFDRIAKPFREQTFILYEPFTIAGCLTFVRVYKPSVDNDGKVVKKRFIRLFFYVQSDKLRNSFDTSECIARLSELGFKPRSEQLHNDSIQIVNNINK